MTALLATAFVVVAAGVSGWYFTRSVTTPTATTQLVAATSNTIRDTVMATGTIAPAREADLTFTVAGTVQAVPVVVGQQVTAGQVLATVGTATLARAVTTAQAQLDAAAAKATSVAGGTDTAVAAAAAQLASAQTSVDDANASLAAATLTSTIDGTVASVSLAVGDRVTGSSSSSSSAASSSPGGSSPGGSSPGGSSAASTSKTTSSAAATSSTSTKTITVISTGSYLVNAAVGSADLAKVTAGLQAEVTPTGANDKAFGTVDSVGIVASTSTSGTATFPVVITITGTPTGLYVGGTASVTIVIKQLEGVLTVPTMAISSADGTTVVTVSKNGKEAVTPVTVGTSYGQLTAITTGIGVGDTVVVKQVAGAGGAPTGTTGRRGTGTTGQTGGGTGGFPAGGGGGFSAGGTPGAGS